MSALPDPETRVSISLSLQQINTIIAALAEMPYRAVASLIPHMQVSAQAQLDAAATKAAADQQQKADLPAGV